MENHNHLKRPKLRWDIPMRQALCCLYRFFRCDRKQKEEIFFSMFRDYLRRRGIHRFVPGRTLDAQWNWMRSTGDLVWSHVHRDTQFNMDGEWKGVIQRIKATAVTLRLPLLEKRADDIDTSQWGKRVATTLGPRPRTESPLQTPQSVPFPLHQRSEQETSRFFSERDHQSSESDTISVGHNQERTDHLQQTGNVEQTDHPRNGDSVVTSHGKICLWCGHGLTLDETYGPDDQSLHTHPDQTKVHDQSRQSQGRHQEHQDWDQQDHHHGQQPQDQHEEQQDQQDQPQDQLQNQLQNQLENQLQNQLRNQLQEHQGWAPHHHERGQQHPHRQGHHHDHETAMQGVPVDKMPPLLFRWSNRDSQGVNSKTIFLAGLFCNGEWFNPEDFSEDRFESFFRSHVTKQEVETPFISTFRSPLAPLHRAIAGRKGAILTVIDTSKLDTKVFYACPLAIRTRTLTYSWKGYGEYLIWGRVATDAIAFSVEITCVEDIAQSHRDVGRLLQIPLIRSVPRCNQKLREMLAAKRKSPFKSGRTLGKLLTLLEVPTIHWDNIAFRFAKSWGWMYKKETALFHSGLRSAPPYLPEELSDSESEGPLPAPQKTPGRIPKKMHFRSDSASDDENYEPPETDYDSGETSESEDVGESPSISMDDMTETADDGNFSTHETLSSGIFDEKDGPEQFSGQALHKEVIDLTSDNEESSSQRALQREWPSDEEAYPDTPTKVRWNTEKKATHRLVLNGHMDMDFFEKFRNWS
ncbi:unnamed protein product [Penicillium egyptiacum]|uniref:DUF7587 domain-containing protein n=1 Tax=Penicillium egyptiacum TaxID=1303716 RepID=A0A9W4P4R4_9EURO|nr:unnamed protein product [Penicillium egyptiacum]